MTSRNFAVVIEADHLDPVKIGPATQAEADALADLYRARIAEDAESDEIRVTVAPFIRDRFSVDFTPMGEPRQIPVFALLQTILGLGILAVSFHVLAPHLIGYALPVYGCLMGALIASGPLAEALWSAWDRIGRRGESVGEVPS